MGKYIEHFERDVFKLDSDGVMRPATEYIVRETETSAFGDKVKTHSAVVAPGDMCAPVGPVKVEERAGMIWVTGEYGGGVGIPIGYEKERMEAEMRRIKLGL